MSAALVAPVKVWTYERIDYDLLRDDTESVEFISPSCAWTTIEAAKAAAEQDIRESYELKRDQPLEWISESNDLNSRGRDAQFWTDGGGPGEVFRVYSIEIVS